MKIKEKVQNDKLTVKVKLSSGYTIDENEIAIIRKNNERGLLRPEYKGKQVITYTGPSGVPLKDFLKKKLSRYDFFYLMIQIVEVIGKIEKCGLIISNIIFDLKYVYINEKTKEMLYIYVPIRPYYVGKGIDVFMEQLASTAEYEDDDIDYVAEFINYVNALDTFDVTAIQQYISGEDEHIARRIARNNYSNAHRVSSMRKSPSFAEEETEAIEQATAVTYSVDEDTTELLRLPENEKQPYAKICGNEVVNQKPRIVNVKTNETVYIDKYVFRIGKERSCVDYFLNNDAVSRMHADIITRNSGHFICDRNSTNHTWVNGTVLAPREEVEIFSGDIIKLAGEEFIFCI